MGERKPDDLCAKACQHLSRQEYQLALQCCDEILAGLPSPSSAPCCSSSATDHSVRLQVLLYRVYALVQLKKFTEAEEDSSSVMCLQRELRGDTLKELLVSILADSSLRGMCQALFSCQSAEHMNEDMKYFGQLLLLLTESQASCTAAGGSVETGGEGTPVERQWRFRDPPRGILGLDEYTLCFRFLRGGGCPLGEFCVSAHSHAELQEWRERLVRRHLREPRAGATPSYSEQLLEKWTGSPSPHAVVVPSLPGVTVTCVPDLRQVVREKNRSLCWMLQLHCDPPRVLRCVALLGELHRPLFSISEVAALTASGPRPYPLGPEPWEWTGPGCGAERIYQLKLRFSTHAYGNFQQAVALDLGSEPVLLQTVRVEQAPPADMELEPPCPPQRGSLMRWDVGCKQVTVVAFLPCDLPPLDRSILQSYRIPAAADQLFTRSVLDCKVTPQNYHARLHDLLYIEENAQYRLLCGFNLQTCLRLMTEPSAPGLRGEYGPLLAGQLFALLSLRETGTEPDSSVGRLVRESVSSMLLSAESVTAGRERVYEARVEACSPEDMCLRLSEECCRDLRLQAGAHLQVRHSHTSHPDPPFRLSIFLPTAQRGAGGASSRQPKTQGRRLTVELQFQLNRLPLCEMHYAVDALRDCTLLFPQPPFPELPLRPESVDGWDSRLSKRQRDALWAIVSAPSLPLPPILLCGPPASGKTFVLLKAVVLLLKEDTSRVLLCTRSEVEADSLVAALALAQGCLLRLWDRRQGSRPTKTPPQCAGAEASAPGMEEVRKSRLVVSTVRQAKQLIHLGLDSGFFTHILVDDASSIVECEALMALSLASHSTRVVLAGDPHQPPPLTHSEFACERDLQRPLLERLCKLYPPDCGCMVWLMEQYRTQRHIVGLVSEVFYGGQLKAASKQPVHKDFFPLSFFVAWGAEKSSCGYYNQAEVMEVADQLEILCKKWPVSWGKLDESSVGVLTPYPAQAVQLRSEARRRGLNCVTVHTLLAPAAPPFRVLFLSTVRTRASCRQGAPGRGVPGGAWPRGSLLEAEETMEDRELGFLSSPRTLHFAMLRAQSLLAVVGDPVALCTVGKCRRIWEHFLRRCASEGSLQGALLSEVLERIDAIEASRACVLNPLAPEFVPRMPPRRTPVQSPCTMDPRPVSLHHGPPSSLPAPWYVLNPLAPEFVPLMPPRRTPVQSPCTMVCPQPPGPRVCSSHAPSKDPSPVSLHHGPPSSLPAPWYVLNPLAPEFGPCVPPRRTPVQSPCTMVRPQPPGPRVCSLRAPSKDPRPVSLHHGPPSSLPAPWYVLNPLAPEFVPCVPPQRTPVQSPCTMVRPQPPGPRVCSLRAPSKDPRPVSLHHGPPSSLPAPWYVLNPLAPEFVPCVPPRRTPVQSPCTMVRPQPPGPRVCSLRAPSKDPHPVSLHHGPPSSLPAPWYVLNPLAPEFVPCVPPQRTPVQSPCTMSLFLAFPFEGPPSSLPAPWYVLNPLAPEFVPCVPHRRTPVQSPCTMIRIRFSGQSTHKHGLPPPWELQRMVKRPPRWHPKLPSPSPRGRYGSMAPPAGPPYLLPLTSGRHCTYGRSLGATGHLDSLKRSIPYSSGLPPPFPLSVSRPVDPRALAGQAVIAYNLGLLRSPRAPPAALPQFLHSSPMLCRNSVDDVPNCARAGCSDWHTALGALQLWGEAENCKQARTDSTFNPRWSCPPSPPHVCRSSTPKSYGSQPPFSPENSPISFNHSRFGLAGRSLSVGPWHSLCSSPSAWDVGHANVRDSVRGPQGGTLKYPQRSDGLGSELHSPPFHDMHASLDGQWGAPPVPSHSKPISPLTQSNLGSLAALESLENPAPWGDIRGSGAHNNVFSWKNLLQQPTHPPQNPMVPPSINTKASLHPYRMGPCPSLSLSPCCPLLEADIISSQFDLACTFQNVPPEQQSWTPADPYSSIRPQHPGHMQEGGRRLYQRCSTRLHPPGGSHQSQSSLHSASEDSISLSLCSAWEERMGERAAVSSPDLGDVCSQEVPLQMASKTTGVPNALGEGDKGDSAYHSNVQ
ncbi:probable helicase with zinc finger domain [Brienomyrus brachyistius]|uniref:probable helicase with zinc finger domain n=1 Tax=Brienomyrus brachyistius TaxID=42636 RepID=UPI0020B20C80|nr:probable helicase with zinc finger domain [Brienomyrus brachyistius]